MDYLNRKLGLVGITWPDTYLAANIPDFLENLEKIKKPSKWTIKNNIWRIGYPGHILILLSYVDLEMQDNDVKVTDALHNEILIPFLQDLASEKTSIDKIVNNPGRYSIVAFLYHPWTNYPNASTIDRLAFYDAYRDPLPDSATSIELRVLSACLPQLS